MALFNDYITTKGKRMLAGMLAGEVENLEFTRVVLGDGENRNPEGATEVISPICDAVIESVVLNDNNVLSITASFTNESIETGFYMKEKGIYISDGKEEVLVIYANAGSTASYIEPAASGLIKKVIRSSITFSQADIINVTLKDSGYANAVDFEEHVKNKENPHNVTAEQVGLGKVPNVATNDQTVTYETPTNLTELTSGEKIAIAFGKITKAVKELISHIKDKISHLTEEEHKELAGLIRLDITGETVDVNKYTLSGGTPKIMRIISKTNGGSSNITNIPVANFPFIMDIELIRWASATDYITRQKFVNANNPANEYVRYCTSGVWGAWVTRVFTDTKTSIAANLTTTTTGHALDATMGKKLQDNKVDKVSGRGLSTNDYTTAEKTKLAGIATGANKTTVDSALSSSSTNPVQNKIVTEQINQLLGLIATQLGSGIKWKNATSCYINGELGTCYYICMPEEDTTNNVGKEVIVVYNNGAIAKGKLVKSGSNYGLENPVTFLTDTTLPLVNKTTIQGGTNTLPYSNNGTIGYCMTPGYGYGATFEISKTNTFTTKYLILN